MVTKTSLYKNWIRIASNFIALIPTELFLFLICWKIALRFKSKRLYRSSGKEIQSRCLVLTFWQKNVNLGRIFISRYCSDGKEMYKKAWSSAKLFFVNLRLLVLLFFPFSFPLLSSPSPLLKLPIVYKRVCFVNEVNKKNIFLFTSFTKPQKLGSSSRRCCCNVQKTVMYVLSSC